MPKKKPKKVLTHAAARAALLDRILAIAGQAQVLDQGLRDEDFPYGWTYAGKHIGLADSAARLFFGLVEQLSTEYGWKDRLSAKAIGEQLRSIITTAVLDQDSGRPVAEEMLAEFIEWVESYSFESVVHVPIENLWLDAKLFGDGLPVGRVTFVPATDELAERLDYYLRDSHSIRTTEAPPVFAVYRVTAEPTRAQELALAETRLSLSLINYGNAATHLHSPHQRDAVAYIRGEQSSDIAHFVTLHGDTRHFELRRMQNPVPIDLTGQVLEGFDSVGFWTHSDLASKPREELNKFQEQLLRAVHWFSEAQSQASRESQLLNLVTCLEALFATPQHDERIAKNLAEGVAIVLYSDLETRTLTKKFVADVYSKRSRISHGGQIEVTQAEVDNLRYLIIQLVGTFLLWQDVVDDPAILRSWLDRSKLASEPVPSPFVAIAQPTLKGLRLARQLTLEDLAARIGIDWIDAECIELWETGAVRPAIDNLRRLAEALDVAPEFISMPKKERIIRVCGYLSHFSARRLGPGLWKAGPPSLDFRDAACKPVRPLDPEDPEGSMNPGVICTWEELGYSRSLALSKLEHRIRTALEQAMEPSSDDSAVSETILTSG